MKIKKISFLILFLCSFNFAFSQKIEAVFIIKNDSLPKKERREFIYLNKETDISASKYIGRVKVTSKRKEMNIALLYLQDKAQKKGTNSFRFVESKNENGLLELIIDAYVIDQETKLQNDAYFPKNKIYFFGRNNTDNETIEEFNVDRETHSLPAYYFSIINFDNQTTIQKGKVLGTTLKVKPQKNGRSVYLNFAGFGAIGGFSGNGGMGVTISGGTITQMDQDLALLLTHIFTEAN